MEIKSPLGLGSQLVGALGDSDVENLAGKLLPKIQSRIKITEANLSGDQLRNAARRKNGGKRYHLVLAGITLSAATTTLTLQASSDLKGVKLFFDDPSSMYPAITALKVGNRTVDLAQASVTVSSGGAAGTSALSGAQYRAQANDFDVLEDGLWIGDVKTTEQIQITFNSAWTTGTPYVGIQCNTYTKGGWQNIEGDDCACDA